MTNEPARKHHVRKWLIWVIAIIIVIALIVIFAGPPIVGDIARHEIESLAKKHLNATLQIRSVDYEFPLGLKINDARLLAPDKDEQLQLVLSVASADIKLGGLPGKNRPIAIQQLTIDHPVVQVGRALQVIRNLRSAPGSSTKPIVAKKPSDLVRLHQLKLTGGEIIYADPRHPAAAPIIWSNLDSELNISGSNPAEYAYRFTGGQPSDDNALVVATAGTINIDDLNLVASQFQVDVSVDNRSKAAGFPVEVKNLIDHYHAWGRAQLDVSGHVPLKHPAQSTFSGRLSVTNFHADQSRWPAPLDRLDVLLALSRPSSHANISADIDKITAASGPARLEIRDGDVAVDPAGLTWRIEKVSGNIQGEQAESTTQPATTRSSKLQQLAKRYTILGRIDFTAAAKGNIPRRGQSWPHVTYKALAYARNASLVIPGAAAPISHITGGPLEFTDHHGTIQNLHARYGYDTLQVATAHLNLTDPTRGLGITQIDATLGFDRSSPEYPKPAAQIMDQLHPQGSLHVIGRCVLRPKATLNKLDYDFSVTTSDLSLAMGPDLFPLDHAAMLVTAQTGRIQLRTLSGTVFGGKINVTGDVAMDGVIAYDAQGRFSNVDVHQAYELIASHGGQKPVKSDTRISGKARGHFRLQNTGMGLENLKASGACGVTGADFGKIPILSDLASAVKLSDAAFTGSDAAAVFAVSEKTLHLTKFALSAPAIGVQGTGSIGLNGQLDLRVIVAPLSNWRKAIKSTGIPLVGELAGAVQNLLNKATRTLLYEFSVTGNVKQPTILPIPVPILTEGVAKLFTGMLKGGPGGLLDAISGQQGSDKGKQ